MKHPKLMMTLVIISCVLSTFSFLNTIASFRIHEMQSDAIEAISGGEINLTPEQPNEEPAVFVSNEQVADAECAVSETPAHSSHSTGQARASEHAVVTTESVTQSTAESTAQSSGYRTENRSDKEDRSLQSKAGQREEVVTLTRGAVYVDLGLPSGTVWKGENEEGLLTYNKAMASYRRNLPTLKQWEELKKYCEWEWRENGYLVTGPNGNAIFFPAAGYRNYSGQVRKVDSIGNYWSSTPMGLDEAWRFGFEPDKFSLATNSRAYGRSVRLCKKGAKPSKE